MKYSIYLTASLLLVSFTAAASQNNSQGNPGFIGASHPLHQVEVVTDNLAVSFGLSNASDVARERLAEANQAAVRGEAKAQERVMKQYNRIAENTRNLKSDGKVRSLLEQVQNQTPDDADKGLRNALNQAENLTAETGVDIPVESENVEKQVSNAVGDLGDTIKALP